MRPIDRGTAPKVYAAYRDAIGDLEDRLGRYCSYCERPLQIGLAVEHVAPKSRCPDLELAWENFLLGCSNCNSVKADKDVDDDRTLWPDKHNTMLALAYSKGGFVQVAEGLGDDLSRRARVLIDLVGLDRHGVDGWPRPAKRDQRWRDREAAWAVAESFRDKFDNSNEALDLIILAAKGYGFFSVWFVIFSRYGSVKRALIEAFPGTAASCFNVQGEPVKRPDSVI